MNRGLVMRWVLALSEATLLGCVWGYAALLLSEHLFPFLVIEDGGPLGTAILLVEKVVTLPVAIASSLFDAFPIAQPYMLVGPLFVGPIVVGGLLGAMAILILWASWRLWSHTQVVRRSE